MGEFDVFKIRGPVLSSPEMHPEESGPSEVSGQNLFEGRLIPFFDNMMEKIDFGNPCNSYQMKGRLALSRSSQLFNKGSSMLVEADEVRGSQSSAVLQPLTWLMVGQKQHSQLISSAVELFRLSESFSKEAQIQFGLYNECQANLF